MFPLRTLILVNVLNSNDGSNEFLTLSLLYMIYDILYRTVRIYINMHTHITRIFLHWRRVLCCDSWRCLGNTPVFISRRAEGAVGNFHCWRAHPPSLSNPSSFCSAVTWSGLSESHCCGYARSKALCVCVCAAEWTLRLEKQRWAALTFHQMTTQAAPVPTASSTQTVPPRKCHWPGTACTTCCYSHRKFTYYYAK